MLVGPSGTGKSSSWRTLLKALSKVDGTKGDFYVIDPKAVKKDHLYGRLDPNTLEWTDGIFTKILRRLADSSVGSGQRGATATPRRSWIVFDGDVDPEWAENLNSVLDDNRVLTLPSGDRLKIPNNVRIMMEVDSLNFATLATVSRCGMVWFAEDTVSVGMMLTQQLSLLRKEPVHNSGSPVSTNIEITQRTREKFANTISPYYNNDNCLIETMLTFSMGQSEHIMEPTTVRLMSTYYSIVQRGLSLCIEYNESNPDFPMSDQHMESFGMLAQY